MTLMKFLCGLFPSRCASEAPTKRAQEASPKVTETRAETAKPASPTPEARHAGGLKGSPRAPSKAKRPSGRGLFRRMVFVEFGWPASVEMSACGTSTTLRRCGWMSASGLLPDLSQGSRFAPKIWSRQTVTYRRTSPAV